MTNIDSQIAETKAALADVHGSECEVYARIVGYYRSVKNWNKGKKEEYTMRKMFDAPTTDECGSCAVQQVLPQKSASNAYELFVRKTCPNCPPVKSYMAGVDMVGKMIDVDTDAGLSEAASRGVFSAPTVIFFDAQGNEKARAHTTEDLDEIFHAA